MSTGTCVIAIDAGTTGVRARSVHLDGRAPESEYREFTQFFPEPGLVEHDVDEIWSAVVATVNAVIERVGRDNVAAIGITNQRETVVAWSRSTGEPHGRAIVWQDRRTADECAQLERDGLLPMVRERTGLVLDPYFSGTKFARMLRDRLVAIDGDLALGTIDSWIIWKLTNGEVHVTDPTNASRTMLYNIVEHRWDDDLCNALNVPIGALPEVRPSSGRFGLTSSSSGIPDGIPISGVAGDQQAALFGQACFDQGMAKNTYGTGSFVLLNVGTECPPVTDGMLTTIAWDLGAGSPTYALEGSIFVTGAAIQWLRDGLGIISSAPEVGPLAATVADSGGVVIVPAFTGLGSPWWDPHARGTICGLTRGSTAAHLARATVESMAFQTRDVIDAMASASGTAIEDLRVDGGASVMDLLLQFQADQLGVTVRRPVDHETTALGAARLAGLAEGVWTSLDELAADWQLDAEFSPEPDRTMTDLAHQQWRRAVERSLNWAG
ncbi:MAG: glycerol kinase GlpK [Ilumatobacteraceae bacterium]|nr:glycerol kinase GlpK [Ilumatobacteraceae bacterium]